MHYLEHTLALIEKESCCTITTVVDSNLRSNLLYNNNTYGFELAPKIIVKKTTKWVQGWVQILGFFRKIIKENCLLTNDYVIDALRFKSCPRNQTIKLQHVATYKNPSKTND